MINKECLFYIDHNPPECSGTWGGAIHKGACKLNSTDCNDTDGCFIKKLYQQLKRKEQELEELHERITSIIYSLTGGRLSYSTYTLEGCEQAYHDQLEIDVERATKELEEENEILKSENFTLEAIIKTQEEVINKYKEAFDNIEQFINITCDACKEFTPTKQSDIICRYCQKTQIEKIINRVKGKKQNEES